MSPSAAAPPGITLRKIGIRYLKDVLALEAAVQNALRQQGHSDYLHPRTRSMFVDRLRNHTVVGAFAEGRLVGIGMIAHPTERGKNPFPANVLPEGPHIAAFNRLYGVGCWGVTEGVMVHPDSRGMGIGHLLVAERLAIAGQVGLRGMVTQVAANNPASIAIQRDNGFQEWGRMIDPGDGVEIMIFHNAARPNLRWRWPGLRHLLQRLTP